jgi:hypothetical protein
MFVITVRESQEVEDDIGTCGMLTVSRTGGGYRHCGRGPANSRVCNSGPACITAWRSFPFSGKEFNITWGSASGGSGR